MSKFFEDTMQGLREAVAIDKGEILIAEKEDMPESAFVVVDVEKTVIDVEESGLPKQPTLYYPQGQ